jgi:hypothetical protein
MMESRRLKEGLLNAKLIPWETKQWPVRRSLVQATGTIRKSIDSQGPRRP